MFQRKPRRFRRRSNDRGGYSHGGSNLRARLRSNSFSNGQSKNKFKPILSAEKLLEKYNNLAKEALSSGDETSCENYLQHADHFMRVIEEKNKNRIHNKVEDKILPADKSLSNNSVPDNKQAKDNQVIEEKKE